MSFESVEGSSSEVNESQEIDEVDEVGSEVSETDDGPEYSLEENMDKLDGDEGIEIDETRESSNDTSEGDENTEYSLEDNMDKLDKEEDSDDNPDVLTLPGLEELEPDEDDEDTDEDEAFVLPGLEPRETGIEIQEDDAPEATPDGGNSPDDLSKTEVSTYAPDGRETKDTEDTGSSDSPNTSSGYKFTPEQRAFRDSLDPSNYSQDGTGEGDKPTSSDANDDEHAEPPERDIADEIPKASDFDSGAKPEKEKSKRTDFIESLKYDPSKSPTIPEPQNTRPSAEKDLDW